MALVIRTVMTYPLNGSTVNFAITFEYLARKFVTVTLVGTDRRELVLNQDYRFTTKNQITLTRAWGPADGYTLVEIRRFTSATDRLVDFADGSILRAYDLNISQIQTLHVAEEARDLTADTIGVNNDGHLDARGRRIVNLGDGVDDGDAVTVRQQKGWAESALNQANRAKTEADKSEASAVRAAASAAAARVSEVNAKTSETNSKTSETNSKTSETNASGSAVTATTKATEASNSAAAARASELNAKASENRAILEADKLGNMNTFAATIAGVSVPTSDVEFKGAHVLNGRIETKGSGSAIIDGTALIRDSLTVGGKTTAAAITTIGNITIGVRSGDGEGSQINFNDRLNVAAAFIDVNSGGELRVVKQGTNAGEKMTWAQNNDLNIRSTRIIFPRTASGIDDTGNLFGPLWFSSSLQADLNRRLIKEDFILPTTVDLWNGDVRGPADIPLGMNVLGRMLSFGLFRDNRLSWVTMQVQSKNDFHYVSSELGGVRMSFPVGGTVCRIDHVNNLWVQNIRILR